jgi:hypothetical protein
MQMMEKWVGDGWMDFCGWENENGVFDVALKSGSSLHEKAMLCHSGTTFYCGCGITQLIPRPFLASHSLL